MKRLRTFIIGIVMVFVVCATTAYATTRVVTKELTYKDIKITLDGQTVVPTDASGNAIEPFIIDGTTYLPIRGIASALGLDVQWDNATRTIILTQPGNSGTNQPGAAGAYRIGDTWTVDGQWSLTITGVTETKDRNQYSEKNPGAVYIVDYTYTNMGYTADQDGIFFAIDDTIVDSSGIMGYRYPGNIVYYAKRTPIGATCNAQECIAVDNPGNFRLTVSKYDNNSEKQSATFEISVD